MAEARNDAYSTAFIRKKKEITDIFKTVMNPGSA